jgi:hypothetical protein
MDTTPLRTAYRALLDTAAVVADADPSPLLAALLRSPAGGASARPWPA